MELHFFCRECGSEHTEPADARLGHLVICLDCAMSLEFGVGKITLAAGPPIAA